MKFCSACGEPVSYRVPTDDNRPRAVCSSCERIHYENPRVIAGTLPLWKNSILLCKRDIEPQRGKWTVPAGFMEKKESLEEGALRETREEANAEVVLGPLFAVYSVVHISQVQMFFLAELAAEDAFSAGCETQEVQLFSLDAIPWDDLAFSAVTFALRALVHHGRVSPQPVHLGKFDSVPNGY